MNCPICEKQTTTSVHYESFSGVEGCPVETLVHTCKSCKESFYSYKSIEKTVEEVLKCVLNKEAKDIKGSDLKFMRTYVGWSRDDLAKIVNRSYETITRYENDATQIPDDFKLLMKLLAQNNTPKRDYPIRELADHDKASAKKKVFKGSDRRAQRVI
jgi:DNA-binding transcriptional regulator YiaG